jgi:uncharacterized protein (DUF1015 family)
MASIRPFRGLRFSGAAGNLNDLTAPPYDVLSAVERDAYAARNSRNIVHLTLPEANPDDRSKFVKYARSSALLNEWRRDGFLQMEERPAIYRYTQTFKIDPAGADLVRTAIITLLKTEPYDRGVVLPHEQTFPKHKEDRLRILEATRAHLECIFGLFEDDGGIYRSICDAPASGLVTASSDDGVDHVLEPIVDSQALDALVRAMAAKKLWIADGHHRYETALNFREASGAGDRDVAEGYLPIALASMSDPGLVLLPTHRILRELPLGEEESLKRLATVFDLKPVAPAALIAEIEAFGSRAFGLAVSGSRGFVLTPKAGVELLRGEGGDRLRSLDVSILHSLILTELLGVAGLDPISYTRDPAEAIAAPAAGAAASFLMTPPSVDDMKAIALGGEKMPQKSTYYFPKILSGLVLWSLNDF